MSDDNQSPYLTVPYQTIFVLDLKHINECFFAKDYDGAFDGLLMLYSDLLTRPRKQIKPIWREFVAQKTKLGGFGVTLDRRVANFQQAKNKFLYENIPLIKAEFIRVLEANKLLNLDLGAKPKYQHKQKARL